MTAADSGQQYIIFAILNFLFVPIVYFFLVETRKRSLEELDVVFAAGGNPVKREKEMRHYVSVEESRQILGLDNVVEQELHHALCKNSGLEAKE